MQTQEIEFLKYPTGKFTYANNYNSLDLAQFIQDIELFPSRLEQTVTGLNDAQLDTPYRPNGRTVRQLVHHCADSHMNSLTRLKLALTEENPTIKPYAEALWA